MIKITINTIFSGVSIDPRYDKENLWHHRISGTGIRISGEEMYLYHSRDWVAVDPDSVEMVDRQNDDSEVR